MIGQLGLISLFTTGSKPCIYLFLIHSINPMAPSLSLSVCRREPVLVAPAKPTPHELKRLSNLDEQESARYQIPAILFYRSNPSMRGRDPARAIRDGLEKVLVFYYPLAGRLREGPGRKLMVECTGEGVLFVEADADARLDRFSDADFLPPVRGLEELLYHAPGFQGVLDCPLILIQVTRFTCGGFSVALLVNHTMCDAPGLVQFLTAVGEMARGALAPTVSPVWARELLTARSPPRVTHAHLEYAEAPSISKAVALFPAADDLVHAIFLVGSREVAALREQLPPGLRASATSFEIIAACLWRSRTVALGLDSNHEVRLLVAVNARRRCNPPLPAGYYGNASALAAAVSSAGELGKNPLGYGVGVIQKAKASITSDYLQSAADLMELRGRPPRAVMAGVNGISDVRRAGFHEVDFGWGKPVYGGSALGSREAIPGLTSFCALFRPNGEAGGEREKIAFTVCLPSAAMQRFIVEIEAMMKGKIVHFLKNPSAFRLSAL